MDCFIDSSSKINKIRQKSILMHLSGKIKGKVNKDYLKLGAEWQFKLL